MNLAEKCSHFASLKVEVCAPLTHRVRAIPIICHKPGRCAAKSDYGTPAREERERCSCSKTTEMPTLGQDRSYRPQSESSRAQLYSLDLMSPIRKSSIDCAARHCRGKTGDVGSIRSVSFCCSRKHGSVFRVWTSHQGRKNLVTCRHQLDRSGELSYTGCQDCIDFISNNCNKEVGLPLVLKPAAAFAACSPVGALYSPGHKLLACSARVTLTLATHHPHQPPRDAREPPHPLTALFLVTHPAHPATRQGPVSAQRLLSRAVHATLTRRNRCAAGWGTTTCSPTSRRGQQIERSCMLAGRRSYKLPTRTLRS